MNWIKKLAIRFLRRELVTLHFTILSKMDQAIYPAMWTLSDTGELTTEEQENYEKAKIGQRLTIRAFNEVFEKFIK